MSSVSTIYIVFSDVCFSVVAQRISAHTQAFIILFADKYPRAYVCFSQSIYFVTFVFWFISFSLEVCICTIVYVLPVYYNHVDIDV